MARLIRKKTRWAFVIERNKRLFRIKTLLVGGKKHLRIRIAFAKNNHARRLIDGHNSIVISYLFPKEDLEHIKNTLKKRWGL